MQNYNIPHKGNTNFQSRKINDTPGKHSLTEHLFARTHACDHAQYARADVSECMVSIHIIIYKYICYKNCGSGDN